MNEPPANTPEPLTPEQQAAVDEMMASPEAQELIYALGRSMVGAVAPQELVVFDATVTADRAERAAGDQGESTTTTSEG